MIAEKWCFYDAEAWLTSCSPYADNRTKGVTDV
jgi:hypothetical protein